MTASRNHPILTFGAVVSVCVAVAGCGSHGGRSDKLSWTSGGKSLVRVAIVSNPNTAALERLTGEFEKANPGIKVIYDTLDANSERSLVETDVTSHADDFNVVMISNFETPLWAKSGWLVDLSPELSPGYDVGDLLRPMVSSLSYDGGLYGVPFSGESSMLLYRRSLARAAGIRIPRHPTWREIAADAARLDEPKRGIAGICLRGQAGWAENLATLDTVINTSGGSWFNNAWQPQLTSRADMAAVTFYVKLIRKDGESGASNDGAAECERDYGEGRAAMWYDSTAAAGLIATTYPAVGRDTGYAYAPTGTPRGGRGVPSGWLYTWSLSIPQRTPNEAAALKYLEWATGKGYIASSGPKVGWANVDPGTRYSTYALPQYRRAAGAFAGITLASIERADPNHPTDASVAVPYRGVQFVDELWFVTLGNEVSEQISAAIAGTESVGQALARSERAATSTVTTAGLLK